MKNRNRNINETTFPVKKTPGKVFIKTVSVAFSPAAAEDTSAKIKRGRISKSSSQIIEETYTVNFLKPYISPEFAKLNYEQNPYHMRAINFKAACIVGAGWDIFPFDSAQKDYTKNAEYKKLYDKLTNEINDVGESFEEVLKAGEIDRDVFGNSFYEIVLDKKGELSELYNFLAYRARLRYDKRFKKFVDAITILQLLSNGQAKEFKLIGSENPNGLGEILWHKNPNQFSKFYGSSEWYSATPKLALAKSIDEFNIKRFTNDLFISFAIVVEGGELSSDTIESIQKFLSVNYKGVENANKVLLLNSDDPNIKIRVEPVGTEVKEASFGVAERSCNDAVIIANGVPPSLIGISSPGKLGSTSENYDLFKVFNTTIVIPQKSLLERKLNRLFRDKLGIVNFYLKFRELSFEKMKDIADVAINTTSAGLREQNEGRAMLGLEPIIEDVNNLTKQVKLIKSKINNMNV
jgi:HK97 family phage portal protein